MHSIEVKVVIEIKMTMQRDANYIAVHFEISTKHNILEEAFSKCLDKFFQQCQCSGDI